MASQRICSIEGCDKPVFAREWCGMHYNRWHRHGDPLHKPPSPQRKCSVTDCDKPHDARGFCNAHYTRLCNYGDPLAEKPLRAGNGEVLEFFQSTVLPYDGDDCLIWPFTRNRKGYARLWYEGRMTYVSRLVCERVHGPPPTASHQSAHSCGKGHEGCVAPRHLRWATCKENHADKVIHGTVNRAKLSEDDIREIRRLIGTMSQYDVAERFGVSPPTISAIKRGKTWRHVKD